jgi:acyl-CoA synthetase (AMP-forming)/AMP-acid ligase II
MPLGLCSVVVNARRCPQRMALSWAGRSIAWDAFNNYVHSTSRYLKEISVRPQASVLVVKENSPAYVIVLLALWRIGAVPCPVDPDILPTRSALVYAAVKPDLVISSRGFKKIWGQKARWADIEHVVAYGYNDSFLGSETLLDPKIDPLQPALLRLKISGEVVGVDALTHEQLKEGPQELGLLLDSLRTGEPYNIKS